MQLVLHTGVHYTEQERLAKTLLRNGDIFAERGVVMPQPDSYRGLVRDTLNAMSRAPVAENARDVLLDAIVGDAAPERLILSDPNFFRTPGTAVQNGQFYPDAAMRMASMAQLFPDDEIEIFLAVRNPAAMLPILHNVAVRPDDAAFWGGRGPQDLRWSELLDNIRTVAPEIPITVWCNEDMPLIWSQIIREIADVDANAKIAGGFDLLMTIMSKEGMQRFRSYLNSHSEMSELQKRRVISAFLDKFALDDEIEEELDMLGWTDDLVEELTALYDDDMQVIEQIPGVTLIAP